MFDASTTFGSIQALMYLNAPLPDFVITAVPQGPVMSALAAPVAVRPVPVWSRPEMCPAAASCVIAVDTVTTDSDAQVAKPGITLAAARQRRHRQCRCHFVGILYRRAGRNCGTFVPICAPDGADH